MVFFSLGYLGMFLSSFLAATILPLSSEVVLTGLYGSGFHPVALWGVASIGNVMGSLVNYALGRKYGRVAATRWLGVKETSFNRAMAFFSRWGKWSLFLSWVPVIGDPITLVAGVLRSHFGFFTVAVIISKAGRYAILLYVLS